MIFKRAIVAFVMCLVGLSAYGQHIVRISGIPDENPTELQRKYQLLVDYLEKKLGAKVVYVPVIDYGAVLAALGSGKIDFAWLGGFSFVQAKVLSGAKPLVMRDIDRHFTSVFVSHVGTGIDKPEDLKGKTFAFGAKSSTSGHLFPRYYLESNFKIAPDSAFNGQPVYSGAHDATVKMVESGKIQAGALNAEVWKRIVETRKVDQSKVKVIWTTPQYVDYVWAAGRDVSPELTKKFADALLALDASVPEEKAILALQGAKQFVPAQPGDFDLIEKIARSTGLLK